MRPRHRAGPRRVGGPRHDRSRNSPIGFATSSAMYHPIQCSAPGTIRRREPPIAACSRSAWTGGKWRSRCAPRGRPEPVGARAEHQSGAPRRLGDGQPVHERRHLVGARVVLDACGEGGQESVGQRQPLCGARYVDINVAGAENPAIAQRFGGPPDRPAFAGSEGSAGDEGWTVESHSRSVSMFMLVPFLYGWQRRADRHGRNGSRPISDQPIDPVVEARAIDDAVDPYCDTAIAVQDRRRRKRGPETEPRHVLRRGADPDREIDAQVVCEPPDLAGVLQAIGRGAHDHDARPAAARRDVGEERHLETAGHAPRRPEIHHHDGSPELGKVPGPSLEIDDPPPRFFLRGRRWLRRESAPRERREHDAGGQP